MNNVIFKKEVFVIGSVHGHIFSHDIVDDVLIADHGKMQKDFGLNTGAVLGKKLIAIELNTLQIYSQETDPRDIE